MGGGLMQLVAYGAQDVYLTGNPQITFFKVVYRRHTNFACESIEQTFNGSVDFGRKVTATISRNGDLITNCWVEATLPDLYAAGTGAATGTPDGTPYKNSVGHALLKEVELEIGGQRIDKHYADWLEIWSELTIPEEKRTGYKNMVGKFDAAANADKLGGKLYVPLVFFFNRNPGLALPLIALQYHEVKINFTFEALPNLVSGTDKTAAGDLEASLYVDYVYLDTDERRRFAQVSHEMLIEQLQFTGKETISPGGSNRVRLNFNHPVKELIWVVKEDASTSDPFNYSNNDTGDENETESFDGSDPVVTAKIQLNGHDRFSERSGKYFRLVQPYQHHTNVPRRAIYSYSFALKPEEHQPSGTCNFSRIDNATLALQTAASSGDTLHVYAVNYNVLRIMSGMGGLAYSN
jgi:hypothetical protein